MWTFQVHIAKNAQKKNCAFIKNENFSKILSPNLTNTYDFGPKKICQKFVKIAQVFPIYGRMYIYIKLRHTVAVTRLVTVTFAV